jgi:cytoskeletal protein CcmA (bactofilin family)
MSRRTHSLIALWLALSLGAAAAAEDGGAQRIGGDLFIGGRAVAVTEPVSGDLFASGGSVDVDAAVTGDALAIGGQVRLRSDVGQSVYAGGGQLQVDGAVAGSLRAFGGQVELGRRAQVQGNVSAVGGNVRLLGGVNGHVQVAGGQVLIDGPVGGDVIATVGSLSLGPNARIAGQLRYRSGDALDQDPGAQVAGGIEKLLPRIDSEGGRKDWEGPPPSADERRAAMRGIGFGFAAVWTLGQMLMAGVLIAALPGWTARVARTVRERTGMSLLMGFVLLVCVPVGVVLLAITLIGLPLALLALALYFALLPLAYVGAAIGLGDAALRRWRAGQAERRGWRIGAACTALVLLALLGAVPLLGGLVGLAALLVGLGALALQFSRPASPAA